MRSEKKERQKFHGRFGESGHYYFTASQTDNRLALCKDCLLFERGVVIRFKKIYESLRDMEQCAILEYNDVSELHERYQRLDELAFGGEFFPYEKGCLPEGALLPFVRARGTRRYELIDTGCIFIGTKYEYPRIFVDNEVARWFSAYSPGGYARKKPFLPYPAILDVLPELMHKKNYADLNIESFV
jgi:hypothetical protein